MDNPRATHANSQPDNQSCQVMDVVGDVGFGLTLAWHYLVLFSPVFGDLSRGAGYSFERQFALYSSIAVTFLLILLLSRKDGDKAGARWHRKALPAFVGAAGTVTSALYAVCVVFAPGDAPCLAVVAMIGVCESALMALWLHAVAKRRSPLPLRSFGVYMIVGGLSAAVVSFTMWPLGPAITACLPVVSALLLAKAYPSRPETAKDAGAFKTPPPPAEAQDPGRNAKASRTKDRKLAVKPQSSAEHAIEAIERVVARRNRIVIASSAVYAFCFGQLQGALTLENVPVLFSSNGAVLLGIALAGLIIYSVPKQANSIIFMNFVHRCSMVVYVAGALALPLALSHPFLAVVAQIVILAGFNLFDFSSLIYGIREDNVVAGITDSTRPIVYGGMAIGLLLGSALVLASSAVAWEDLIVVLCSFSVVALVATMLMPLCASESSNEASTLESAELHRCENCSFLALSSVVIMSPAQSAGISSPARPMREMPASWKSPWALACETISKLYQLSPRENDVFMLLAKGRNTEYIQKKLVISTHTAKSHIANIYRKLEVHSSQELLDLVEEIRSKKDREGDGGDD